MSTSPRSGKSEVKAKTSSSKSKKPPSTTNFISPDLEATLHMAFVDARQRRHEFITIEHLLFGLLSAALPKETLTACGADIDDLKTKLSIFIDENTPVVSGQDDVDTQPTLGFQRVIQRSIMHVQSTTRKPVTTNDVLLALFGEKDSHAVYYLSQQGVSRVDVDNYISNGVRKPPKSTQRTRGYALEAIDTSKIGRDFFALVSEASQPFVAVDDRPSDRPKLFISYSHTDTSCLERLLVHLKPLERSNSVVCWSDKRLRTGDKWKTELEQNLNDSVIAILLVSADFLASDFIVNNELPPLLIKADSKGLRILPVILKPCGFRRDPILSAFQSANDPASPLLGMSPMDQESLYDKIAEEVSKEVSIRRVS